MVDEKLSNPLHNECMHQIKPNEDSSREGDELGHRSSYSHLSSGSDVRKIDDLHISISERQEIPPLSPDRHENRKAFQLKDSSQSKLKPRSSSIDDPITPGSSKMAQKMAQASSRADKTFSELMVTRAFDDIITSTVLSNPSNSFENYSRQSNLIGGAFNTISNSSVEPHLGNHAEAQVPTEVLIPSPSFKPPIFESGLVSKGDISSFHLSENETNHGTHSPQQILKWIHNLLEMHELRNDIDYESMSYSSAMSSISSLLDHDSIIDDLCFTVIKQAHQYKVSSDVKSKYECDTEIDHLEPFRISPLHSRISAELEYMNFVRFLQKLSTLTNIESPVLSNGILDRVLDKSSTTSSDISVVQKNQNMRQLLFRDDSNMLSILRFMWRVLDHFSDINCLNNREIDITHITSSLSFPDTCMAQSQTHQSLITPQTVGRKVMTSMPTIRRSNVLDGNKDRHSTFSETQPYVFLTPPASKPCPFEIAIWNTPEILSEILSCLGDPVVICRFKAVNKFCNRFVFENEYHLMKKAVRIGGIQPHMRPAFWMYITLSRCVHLQDSEMEPTTSSGVQSISNLPRFHALEQEGRASKWHHVITRDVSRAFGTMPPHKRSTRSKSSIVRALVSWGRENLIPKRLDLHNIHKSTDIPIRRIVVTSPMLGMRTKVIEIQQNDDDEIHRTDTVSDWGGISPLNSNISHNSVDSVNQTDSFGDVVLSGNGLSSEMKSELQKKLEIILNAIAAAHKGVGYCQGMDYVVAHLLRVLQETIEWRACRSTLPSCIKSYQEWTSYGKIPIRDTVIVEECVFLVMHTFLCTYNLRHMYWPELRCLKTCCRIFSKIIQKKLPVLADHFDHHELNVGLFALGWFQTLFLYIPSMPSKTINHMWDIWLVERSMKIFYRIGCAILFLSQPILLNNELEGMMTYLNTFPDATIFSSDILISCALQIKITAKMLSNIEFEVIHENDIANQRRSPQS